MHKVRAEKEWEVGTKIFVKSFILVQMKGHIFLIK